MPKAVDMLEPDDLYEYEQEIRHFIGSGDISGAKDHYDAFDGTEQEKIDLWHRFPANERSAMKERREVRPGRKPKAQSGQSQTGD